MELHTEVLLRARYHIKTTLGASDDYYSHSNENTQVGTVFQFAWAVISSLILGIILRRLRVSVCKTRRQTTTTRAKDGFVDDLTARENQFLTSLRINHHRIEHIAIELQAMAQQREKMLHSTGSALELSMRFYKLIKWVFNAHFNPVLVTPNLSARRHKQHNR
jgi:hypothetical protein